MMTRLLTKIFFITFFIASAAIVVQAACPTAGNTVIEVCNDSGGNGTIRAYFFDGTPALSYVLFSLSPPGPVSVPFGTVTVNTAIPLPPGAVAGVEFGLVPNGDYIIRVNCSPSPPGGTVIIGGFGINVNSANALAIGVTVDPDCQPLTGAGNADGSITLAISGGKAPYNISWPTAVTPIANSIAGAPGSYTFPNLDGGAYTVRIVDANNCILNQNIQVPIITIPLAGSDQTVCSSSATLNGNAPGVGEIGTWTGPGGVTFSPNANTPNAIANSLSVGNNTLTWTITDTGGTCPGISDQVIITSIAPATVNAGPDQTICAGSTVTLNGTIGGSATTGTWSGGTGTFAPNNTTLNAVYTPSAAEVTAGTVTLTLTTNDPDGAGPCVPVSDAVTITINALATVNAGPDQTICAGSTVTLNGTIGGSATMGTWSGGTGTFAPNNTTLNAVYTPSAAEVTANTVTLTLTTTGPCAPVSDAVMITINPSATVNAGPDQAICAGSTVTLNGTIGGSATTGTWSGGTGTFAPNNTTLNAIYTPSAAEVTAGTVTLTLTTTGPCAPVSDAVLITINALATVNAGADQTICAGSTVTLNGIIGGSATSGTWSGGAGTFAPNNTTLNAVYTPSAAEVTANTVTLTLTTTGPCAPASDAVMITINTAPIVNAGADQTICAGNTVTLNGTIGGSATTGTWTGGTGVLTPNNTTLNAVYTPSAAEVTAGTVTLTLTTNDPDGAGPCLSLADNVTITISPGATVDAGAPQTICAGGTATLAGSFTGTTGITWSTSGDGSFNNASLTNAIYTPGANDITNTTVTLTITTGGPCTSVNDNVVITITLPPTVDAGPAQTICSTSLLTMNGTFGGSATGLLWTSSGDGIFDDNTDPNAMYTPGSSDITNGSVVLTATATGSCPGVMDNVNITINAAAIVDAGAPQTTCLGSTVTLDGTLSGSATSITWSTSGDGTFNNINDPDPVYSPGSNDQLAGTVTLSATSNNPPGPCPAGVDNVVITLRPIPGDQTTAGNQTWIGYVYTDQGDPTLIPAKINFASSKYRGFIEAADIDNMSPASTYDISTDKFDHNPGLFLPIQGPNVCGNYLSFFSIRYKMNKTFTGGIYRFTVGADDGVRLLIDGVNVLPATAFDFQSYTTYTSVPICLSAGMHTFEIHYFDNTAQSRLTFDYAEVPSLTTISPVTICVNSPSPVLTASSTDAGVLGFNWYKGATLVFSGSNYTPAATELNVSTVGSTTFTVRSVYSCGETSPTNVVVNVVNTASLIINPETTCESGGIVDLRTLVNESPLGGTFVFTGHPNISGNNFDPSGLAGNTVPITVNYSSGSCTAPQGTLNLTISNSATITVPATTVSACESAPDINLTTLVTASPGGGTFTFSGTQVTGNLFNPSGLSGLQTITVNYSIGGCVAPQRTFQISVNANASITTNNASSCENGPSLNLLTLVSATPSGGLFTFTGTGVSGSTFDPTGQSGTININVTYNISGCMGNGTIQVTVLSPTDPLCSGSVGTCASVVIVPKPSPATCTNSNGRIIFSIKPFTPAVNNTGVKITIDGISSTNISISRTNFNDSIFNALPTGTYDYSIEYGDPSCIKTGRVTVDQSGTIGTPIASNIISPVCFGSSTGSMKLDVSGETGNVLEWSLDGGITDPFKPFIAGSQIAGIPAGPSPTFEQVISVRRNITDPCFASVTVVISESAQPISATFSITPATCNGNDGAITNIVPSGGKGIPYSFSINGGQSFQTTTTFNGLSGGSYTLKIKDGGGCENDFTATVTFPGIINSAITKRNADCSNNGNSGSIAVTVNDPGTFEVALSNDQFNRPAPNQYRSYSNPAVSFNGLSRGQYFVYTKSNSAACPTRSAPINIFGIYAINFDIQPVCKETDLSISLINVTGETGGAPLEIQFFKKFSTGPPEIIYKQFPANGEIYLDYNQHIFLQTPGEYQIKIIQFQNDVACNVSSQLVDFKVPEPLFARVGGTNESYPDIPTGSLQIAAITGGLNPYDVRIELDSASSLSLPFYQTNFVEAGLNNNQQFEIVFNKIPAGRYKVEVMDSLGCILTLVARVPLDIDLYIPNVFTPNGDGSNDVFYIRNLPPTPSKNQLIISNRWGKEIFASKNYQNNWEGEGAADGIYYYRLQMGSGAAITGWMEIIRGQKP